MPYSPTRKDEKECVRHFMHECKYPLSLSAWVQGRAHCEVNSVQTLCMIYVSLQRCCLDKGDLHIVRKSDDVVSGVIALHAQYHHYVALHVRPFVDKTTRL